MGKFDFETENEKINQERVQKKKIWSVCRCKQESVSACINCCCIPKDEWWLRLW